MERIQPRNFKISIPVVHLYLQDITTLLSIMSGSGGGAKVETAFVHEDMEYDSLDELRAHVGPVISELEITVEHLSDDERGDDQRIELDFNQLYVHVYALLSKLDEIAVGLSRNPS